MRFKRSPVLCTQLVECEEWWMESRLEDAIAHAYSAHDLGVWQTGSFERLSQGKTNEVFCLTLRKVSNNGKIASIRKIVVRFNNQYFFEIDRDLELQTLKFLSRHGLFELVHTFAGGIAYSYVEGVVSEDPRRLADRRVVEAVAKQFARLHACSRTDAAGFCEHFGAALADSGGYALVARRVLDVAARFAESPNFFLPRGVASRAAFREVVQRSLGLARKWFSIATPLVRPALCHLDAHIENLVMRADGSCALIDWEYAAVSVPAFELASFLPEACGFEVDAGLLPRRPARLRLYSAYTAAYHALVPPRADDAVLGPGAIDDLVTALLPAANITWGVWAALIAEGRDDFLRFSRRRFRLALAQLAD